MVKKHGKKQRARAKARRTGAGYASAAAGTAHEHTPLPDMGVLMSVPHGGGRPLNLELAARLVAACRTACRPCQTSLAQQMRLLENRATLAALAGTPFGILPSVGSFASETTRAWALLARAATAERQGDAALAAVEAMADPQASELLEDALDHWALGGASPEEIADMIQVVDLHPQDLGSDPEEGAEEVDKYADIVLFNEFADSKGWAGGDYTLHPGYVELPDGRPLPLIALEPCAERAGLEDLRTRCGWSPWNGRVDAFPELDVNWRVRARIGAQVLEELAHTDAGGWDDIRLWRGEAKAPRDWWDLLDVAGHTLLCGPVASTDPHAIGAAAEAGQLTAVVARARFS
ncbi:hypothetical protein [Streptomyces sp. Isolate_45]|uniref:hypothetical protein n=1 Tax=Streptomyces sp. Isolate_45 TaxID=2950111 RepID=UPI002481CE7A|nr:hypothetical protein [Streptomyces sp. Isolate_45]MDA5279921.1 hypothetical protein [Streptomyces sp. Isolate_45]